MDLAQVDAELCGAGEHLATDVARRVAPVQLHVLPQRHQVIVDPAAELAPERAAPRVTRAATCRTITAIRTGGRAAAARGGAVGGAAEAG